MVHVVGLSMSHPQASSKFISMVMLAHFKQFFPVLLIGENKSKE